MTTSAVYPTGIAPALGHLNSSQNSIEIFVEDETGTNMWRNILRAFLPVGTAFSTPIQLGGRDRVIDECKRDQADDGRKKLYIIDADIDILLGRSKPRLKHLYRLRSYCIENYLIQEKALIDLACILDPEVDELTAVHRLDFEAWIQSISGELEGLFVCYGTSLNLGGGDRTIRYHVANLTKPHPNHFLICERKAGRRIFALYRRLCRDFGLVAVRQMRENVLANAVPNNPISYASAKHYLLPLVFARLRTLFGQGMSDNQMKSALSRTIDSSIDPYLAKRFRSIL
ncbi:DUF4435 domain-containing protein [Oceaniglobus ichthyenteri]|uniref:DUF4435 domain-containing protein n=1 Tax=Oceaniglobus ichthyenteri TaxID=2136177 RepID=UPI000D338387|nr:DUF4435 domain-containing protein [Oceaniglobus ichthyenteri]